MDDKDILIKLSQLGALERYINITTRELGEMLGSSQQSASLYLQRMEGRGLIERSRRKSGTSIRIAKEGVDQLMGLLSQLNSIFNTSRNISVTGKISAGLGEGAYYLSQKRYIDQLKEKFGMDPFKGTLNVILSQRDAPVLDLLRRGPGVIVEGFTSGGRSFGRCICYPCQVNKAEAVIMVPNRTVHEATLEIVSSSKLRDHLKLDEGDDVEISIMYPAFE